MKRIPLALTQRQRMARYYKFHSKIYDTTRWMFLFGRNRIIQDLAIRPGETVIDIGCGTGGNVEAVQTRLEGRGQISGVDCSPAMLSRASRLSHRTGWANVDVFDYEYGTVPVNEGKTDVVLMSYSLSMIPAWQQALKCAKAE